MFLLSAGRAVEKRTMDAHTSLDEGITWIADEPGPKSVARRRPRIGRWVTLVAVFGPTVVISALVFVANLRRVQVEQCSRQLTRLGVALNLFQDAHGHFPAPAIAHADGTPLLSWRVAILPSLGYQSLYNRFRLDEPWDSPHNRALLSQMPAEFACPSGPAALWPNGIPGDRRPGH